MRVILQRAMAVTVEMPCTMMRVIPNPHCVVAKGNTLLPSLCIRVINCQFMYVFNPLKGISNRVGSLIVVAANQMNTTVKAFPKEACLAGRTEEEVS